MVEHGGGFWGWDDHVCGRGAVQQAVQKPGQGSYVEASGYAHCTVLTKAEGEYVDR